MNCATSAKFKGLCKPNESKHCWVLPPSPAGLQGDWREGTSGADLSPVHLVANTFLMCCHFLYFSQQHVNEQVGQYNCLHIKP